MVSDPKKFHSPVPFFIQLKRLIFGKVRPDSQTRISFYFISIVAVLFMVWNVFGVIAIKSSDFIKQQKGISIENIIESTATELGFNNVVDFMERLFTYYSISVILWAIVLFGSILLYRKKRRFSGFILSGVIIYVGMTILYVGFKFFMTDTTTLDKILMIAIIVITLVQRHLLFNEKNGGSSNLFGVVDDTQAIE